MITLGIDLGTSEVKVVALEDGCERAHAAAPLSVSQPQPLWSEQDPQQWWEATQQAVGAVRARMGAHWSSVAAIGLSGQMHGAVLLDAQDHVLRPAILWNDGRSQAECAWLEQAVPELHRIAGNLAMPGFTAPKLLWVARHEPALFAATARVLLPKDWLRLQMTGEAVSEMSDAAGTLWLDVQARRWSPVLLSACALEPRHMPRLVEGCEVSAGLRPAVARAWGLPAGLPVAGGAGDNAASAIGVGAVDDGEGFVSLGTSGVVFVVNDRYAPNPGQAVHTFCHALPGRWHQMAVTLSAASSLRWLRDLLGGPDEAALADAAAGIDAARRARAPLFLPYLAGERTPHNDARASGVLFGLRAAHGRADLAHAVMEGVALSIADGVDALRATGTSVHTLSFVGGGSRSPYWGALLASATGCTLVRRVAGERGAAVGAARLAALARLGVARDGRVTAPPPVVDTLSPSSALVDALGERRRLYRALYPALRALYAQASTT